MTVTSRLPGQMVENSTRVSNPARPLPAAMLRPVLAFGRGAAVTCAAPARLPLAAASSGTAPSSPGHR